MAAREPVVLVLAPAGLGDALALVLTGLGQRVLYSVVPESAACGYLPRLPEPIARRLMPAIRGLFSAAAPVPVLHAVEPAVRYWDAGVRYCDSAGVTLRLQNSLTMPRPDEAPRWQSWWDVSELRVPPSVGVESVDLAALELGLQRRWGRSYWQGRDQPEPRRLVRRLALVPAGRQDCEQPTLHRLQSTLDSCAWSRLSPDSWQAGAQHWQLCEAPGLPAVTRRGPWAYWSQNAALARGSAWWYDACGALPD